MLGNIVKIVQFFSLLVRYWSLINKVVRYVETFKNLYGKEKKEKAMEIIFETIDTSNLNESKKKHLKNFLSALTDAIVAFLNMRNAW
ncbi:MAG: hypothetical protein QXX30_00170 [Candidatus Aenigmatarchaeota archaeon]